MSRGFGRRRRKRKRFAGETFSPLRRTEDRREIEYVSGATLKRREEEEEKRFYEK